jgi:F-type H+-transporting ATPase subunit a
MQAAIELVLEMVDNQARSIVHNAQSRKFVGPLALTVFIWVFLMNAMDFLPVDLIPELWRRIFGAAGGDEHHAYMRVVPTADLSGTLGLSIGVLLVVLYYNVKIKGLGGFVHELFAAPFGDKWFLYPANFLMQMIEFLARTVSHGMRLFGNMYAGELLFMLIALMGAALVPVSATGIALVARPCRRGHRLGHLPHPDRPAAGLHLHDADTGLRRPGPRQALIGLLSSANRFFFPH